jgi:hypothetical protein
MSRLSSGDSGNGSAPYPSGKKKRQLVSFSPESTSIWAALASTLELSKKIPGNRSQLQRIVPDHDKILRFLNLLNEGSTLRSEGPTASGTAEIAAASEPVRRLGTPSVRSRSRSSEHQQQQPSTCICTCCSHAADGSATPSHSSCIQNGVISGRRQH